MQIISPESINVASYSANNAPRLNGIYIDCSGCRKSVLMPAVVSIEGASNAIYKCKCPSCGKAYELYCVTTLVNGNRVVISQMYINPDALDSRVPIIGPEDMRSEKLYKSYMSTIEALNRGAIGSVPVIARKTLEGIVKKQLSEKGIEVPRGRMLGQLLTELTDKVDLADSLNELARVLTAGGNIGAHFDEELEDPNEEMAEKMLGLLETLIEYFYVLPARINDFRVYVTNTTTTQS